MSEARIIIEKMCYGGSGFGRVGGKACFVPFTAPGDEATIRITKEKKSYLEGELLEISAPSHLRTPPTCPIFASCGGCNWQHLPYLEQLRQKGEIFTDTLRRIGRAQEAEILPVLPCEHPYGYRSRIQLKLSLEHGGIRIGFFRGSSHEVVDAPAGCPIAHPLLNRIASEFRLLLPKLPEAALISQLDLSMGDDGEAIAICHFGNSDSGELARKLLEARRELASVSGLYLNCGGRTRLSKVFGIDRLSYRIPAGCLPGSREMRLGFSRGGFSQVNYLQNLNLVRTVWQWGEFTASDRVLDLYCGNGNLSVPIAPYVREMVGLEGYAPSIEDAIGNARDNGVGNATFKVGDAARAVDKMADRGERFDVVILDPPRAGAAAASSLARLDPRAVLYVSCDPPTLARDLCALRESGFTVVRSLPVDMFPQTYHTESVTLLRRPS